MIENVIIMGAAGRDFHNFNVYFRDNLAIVSGIHRHPDPRHRRSPLSGRAGRQPVSGGDSHSFRQPIAPT
jgi:hypothetical protein